MAKTKTVDGGTYAPEAREKITQLGPESLPDNPSGKGLTARQIKLALAWGLYYLFDLAKAKEEEDGASFAGKVPYSGATGSVDLGANSLSGASLAASGSGASAKLLPSGIEVTTSAGAKIAISWPDEGGKVALKADEEAIEGRVTALESGLSGAEIAISELEALFSDGVAKKALADRNGNTIDLTYATEAALEEAEGAIDLLETYFSGGKANVAVLADRATADKDGNEISGTYLKQSEAGISVATLSGGKVPSSQLPAYVDDVLEYASLSSFPGTGEDGKIYVAEDTNLQYRWSGTQYVEISKSLALGETSSTAFPGDRGKELEAKAGRLEAEASAMQAGIDALESGKQDELEAPTASQIQQWWDEAEE